jgi:very-short-patch-repair endonuclease
MAKFTLDSNSLTISRARKLRKEMTDAERKLWSMLRGDQWGVRFRRQAPIGPYIADFVCLKAKLVIELDGEQHYTPEGRAHDSRRDAYLRGRGLTVMRFSTVEFLKNSDAIVDEIEQAIVRAKDDPTLTSPYRGGD